MELLATCQALSTLTRHKLHKANRVEEGESVGKMLIRAGKRPSVIGENGRVAGRRNGGC